MTSHDLAYFQRRAESEREAARDAPIPSIADIHLKLAAEYEALIELAGLGPLPAAEPA